VTRGKEGPYDIDGEIGVCRKEIRQADPRMGLDVDQDECGLLRRDSDVMRPKILQKLQVLDIYGMILGGRAHSIRQPQRLGIRLPRGTAPLPGRRLVILRRFPGKILLTNGVSLLQTNRTH